MHGTGADLARVAVSGFLAVLFLQAGLDKVLDRKGNRMRYQVVFGGTPMRRPAKAWLTLLTLSEVLAGIVSAAGCLSMLLAKSHGMALAGAVLGTLSIVWLFFGLRLARDYTGASATVPYFVTCLAALVLLG